MKRDTERTRRGQPVASHEWLTRTAFLAHLYQCGFGFAILARIIHKLSPLQRTVCE